MKRILFVVAASIAAAVHVSNASASPDTTTFVRPVDGSIVLAGTGNVPDSVRDVFLHLCRDATPNLIVVTADGSDSERAAWIRRGAHSVVHMTSVPSDDNTTLLKLLEADGVWFCGCSSAIRTDPLMPALLEGVLARGGVVGGTGDGAHTLLKAHGGFDLLPDALVELDANPAAPAGNSLTREGPDGLVTWVIPPETSMIVHSGRQVAAIGNANVTAKLPGTNGWTRHEVTVEAIDVFDPGDRPSYAADFVALRRSARQRAAEAYPPAAPVQPILDNGTLVLHGGRRVNDETFEVFIEAAGGRNATLVCIPSAQRFDADEEPDSYSQERLRDLGCTNVHLLHADDPELVDGDARLLASLENATGVWIDGGRTYRLMDRFEGTRAHELIHGILDRGGVVGGSSAGSQVAGDMLVRGDPRTNSVLAFDGYLKGLQLLRGVVMDAHFLQRERGEAFGQLISRYPVMLGIGVDENTAIVVRGSVGTVIGENVVTFYDAWKRESPRVTTLANGEAFDLARRRRASH